MQQKRLITIDNLNIERDSNVFKNQGKSSLDAKSRPLPVKKLSISTLKRQEAGK